MVWGRGSSALIAAATSDKLDYVELAGTWVRALELPIPLVSRGALICLCSGLLVQKIASR